MTWTSTAGLLAVRLHITFMAYRKLMETTAIELATNPTNKLLAKYGEAPGVRQIERFFKQESCFFVYQLAIYLMFTICQDFNPFVYQ
jgi:hypothetical protein